MARPISWLHRLREIRRSVANSVRSHYDRGDLQILFELQPRSASGLLEILPTVAVGVSHLVAREDLAKFLTRISEAKDVAAVIEQMRAEKAGVSRKKVRSLVRRDVPPATMTSLPDAIVIERGRLEVRFQSTDRLAEHLLLVARILESEGDEFAAAYDVIDLVEPDNGAGDVRAMFEQLKEQERDYATAQ